MRTTRIVGLTGLALTLLLGGACNHRPNPLKTADGQTVTQVQVDVNNTDERKAVTDYNDAAANYRFALRVLQGYYYRVGAMDKYNWTQIEMKNLDEADIYNFGGVDKGVEPPGQSVGDATEPSLVERVLSGRKQYLASLTALQAYYNRTGMGFKLALAQNVRARYRPEETFAYLPEAEMPPLDLKATEVVPAADELYARAFRLYKDGKPLPLITGYNKERQALQLFLQLVHEYPNSNRIALSAYFIAEIYKEYYKNEELRAVEWYKRAWTWDPYITEPARFQAAVLYDYRLQEKAKALELYRATMQYEQFNSSNVSWARDRIEKLSGQ